MVSVCLLPAGSVYSPTRSRKRNCNCTRLRIVFAMFDGASACAMCSTTLIGTASCGLGGGSSFLYLWRSRCSG
eukprot:6221791-Ditylum_brightwellii.AAC.1